MLTVFEVANPFTPALNVDAPLENAISIFSRSQLRALPVVREGVFCGVLERHSMELGLIHNGTTVRDVFSRDTVFLSPRDAAQDAADLLAIGVVDMIPIVTAGGCLAGIVTQNDLPPSMRHRN